MLLRRGIRRAVIRTGIGVHSGVSVTVRLEPSAPGSGIVFDTPDGAVPALHGAVQASEQRTALRQGRAQIETVEHLLAACYGLGVDDLSVVVDGPELPIFDGSALPWAEALNEAGMLEAALERRSLRVRVPVEVRQDDRWARLEPAGALELDIAIAFADPAIGRQRYQGALTPVSFMRDIAPARTFGFARDLDRLRAMGLGRGAGLENTVAFEAGRVLNPEGLRFADEPVRHKVLDVLGDLALLGAPLRGRLSAERPGHGLTHALLQEALARDALG